MQLNHKFHDEKRRVISRINFSILLILGLPIILNLYLTLLIDQNSKLFYDTGIWLYLAKKILDGKILYLDVYEDYPPGMPYTYALLIVLTRNNYNLIRIIFAFITIGSILCVYALVKKLYSERSATLAVYLLCLNPQIILWTKRLMAEPISNFWFFLGFLFLIKAHVAEGWKKWSALSGIFLASAFLYRQSIVCLFPGILFYELVNNRPETDKRERNWFKKGRILSMAIIFVLSFLFLVLGVFFYAGSDISLIFSSINIVLPLERRIAELKRVLIRSYLILGLAAIAFGLIPLNNYLSSQRLLKKPDMLFISWSIVSGGILFLSPRPWAHTYVHFLPVAAILGARALDIIIHSKIRLPKITAKKITFLEIRRISIFTIVILTFFAPIIFSQSYKVYIREPESTIGWVPLKLLNDVGDYVKNVTKPEDVVFSLNPSYLYFSEREHNFFYPFIAGALYYQFEKIEILRLVDEYFRNNPVKCIIRDPLTSPYIISSTLKDFYLSTIFWEEDGKWFVSIYLALSW